MVSQERLAQGLYVLMTDEKEPPEPQCGYARCDPSHVLHCCHTATAVTLETATKGVVLRGWECVFCHKASRTWILCRMGQEPRV